MKRTISKKIRCPDCGKADNCIRLKDSFTIYFANVRFEWYKCTRCNKVFSKKVPIKKKGKG